MSSIVTSGHLLAFVLICLFSQLYSTVIPEKVLICGIGKNVQHSVPNVIRSATELGEKFLDYRVIIYENNSKDKTKKLFQKWAYRNHRVIFLSEYIDKKELAEQFAMKVYNRTEAIARARNKVLDVVMEKQYRDFKYVIWVDLDLQELWDIPHIVDTILNPEQEWDAVLANGAYDLFAFRDREFPIGFELIGNEYDRYLDAIRKTLYLDPQGPWRKVYSAFGGLGIYKRSSIKKCRYSGIITQDLESTILDWLEQASTTKDTPFYDIYQRLLATHPIIDVYKDRISNRHRYPETIGVRLHNEHGFGKIVWFSCTHRRTLPWVCEHIPFHASMIVSGHDKIFINPRLISNHP